MPNNRPDELVFIPLGGVGEIGMNMAAYGFGPANRRKWIVVDCGVTFGGPQQPGIELIMADPTFLEENADDVLGLILTHSHEDHYGAVLDLWPGFDRPVYATAVHRRHAGRQARRRRHRRQRPRDGRCRWASPSRSAPSPSRRSTSRTPSPKAARSSSPPPSAVSSTPATGSSIRNPIGSPPTDVARLEAIGREEGAAGADLRLHKRAEGRPEPERGRGLLDPRGHDPEAPHRVALTTFASNVGRVIAIARAAQKAGRQVVLSGRALHRISGIARELGMLEGIAPFLDQDEYKSLPRNKVCLLVTGSARASRAPPSPASRARSTRPSTSTPATA
jgi:ribonuclease J